MRINTNIQALDVQRNLMTTSGMMSKSIEKLSSGLRINRAADDAAGLSISEKLRSQIRGLAQAQRNAQDGISMLQTAEGALTEVHAMLQRMRELSVQASNDTLSAQDTLGVNTEIQQMRAEIDSISVRTKFNGKSLLTGSLVTSLAGATGADLVKNDTITNGTTDSAMVTNIDVAGERASDTFTFTGAGTSLTLTRSSDSAAQTVTTSAIAANGSATLDFSSLGVKVSLASTAGQTAAGIVVGLTDASNDTILTTGTGSANLQIGANASDTVSVSFTSMSISALVLTTTLNNYNGAQTVTNAQAMITALDTAIQAVSTQRADLGARQNRLEHTINSLGVTHENLAASESRVRDADIASEMTTFTKYQILQQAGTAILAQANQVPQGVLSLLR